MKRREFITICAGAPAWALAAQAQQPSMPVIGYLNGGSPDAEGLRTGAFQQGLKEAGYAEGENVKIEYRWAESRYERLPGMAADRRHKLPAIYQYRLFAIAGGLVAYGASIIDSYRQAGIYAGRVLKAGKAAELPVLRSTKFEMIINLKTAQALGLNIPPGVLAIADEVVE